MAGLAQPRTPSIYSPPVKQLEKFTRDYVAGDDCQVFINTTYVDQVALLQYQLINTRRPVYGYHSPFLDGMLPGQELVHGRLTVYKIVDNYLNRVGIGRFGELPSKEEVLHSFDVNSSYEVFSYLLDVDSIVPPAPILIPFLIPLLGQVSFQTYLESLAKLQSETLPGVSENAGAQLKARRRITTQVIAYKRRILEVIHRIYGSSEKFIDTLLLSEVFKKRFASASSRTGIHPSDLAATNKGFTKKVGLEDVFMRPFNLSVYMGVIVTSGNPQRDFAIVARMEDVHITGHSTPHETSGAAITTSYDFIAQRYSEFHVQS